MTGKEKGKWEEMERNFRQSDYRTLKIIITGKMKLRQNYKLIN